MLRFLPKRLGQFQGISPFHPPKKSNRNVTKEKAQGSLRSHLRTAGLWNTLLGLRKHRFFDDLYYCKQTRAPGLPIKKILQLSQLICPTPKYTVYRYIADSSLPNLYLRLRHRVIDGTASPNSQTSNEIPTMSDNTLAER